MPNNDDAKRDRGTLIASVASLSVGVALLALVAYLYVTHWTT